MSGKMKATEGSGRVWNLIMGVFERGHEGRTPNRPRNFSQQVYSLASAMDSDCSRTAPGHCYGNTQQLQQRQVSKRIYTVLTIRNAARNDVRV